MPAKKCHSGSERRKVAQTFHSNNPVETSESVRDGHPAGDRRNVLHVLKKPGNSMTRKMKTMIQCDRWDAQRLPITLAIN
ncbi:MAG TPA: hypothetical protein VG103_05290 [Chthoniobacterales bacterium]|jgi:hypothetical protein|nr:hypothetical protein [Chthoniobacterales bacterium]